MNNKKTFFNLNFMLMLFAFIPLITASLVLTVYSAINTKAELERETKKTLMIAAESLHEYYALDYNEDGEFTYDHEFVDQFLTYDLALTVFQEDVRFLTSLKDDQGNRIEGTAASAEVWAKVKAGEDYYSDDIKINNKDYYVYYTPIKDTNDNVVGMAFAGLPCADITSSVISVVIVFSIISLVVIVIFVFIVLFFSGVFSKPLIKVSKSLLALADGNITDHESIHTIVTETIDLVSAYDKLHQELSSIIGKTKDTALDLSESMDNMTQMAASTSSDAEQISAVIEDLAQGATQLAQSVQDISNQTVEMDTAINNISADVDTLAQSSENIKSANNDASEYMTKVSASSQQSVEAVQSISEQITSTNEAIKSIEEAIAVITSVASQTNLLALNASIEAARAGEAGRGFAVVASEIQNLSEQSNSGANRITEIVSDIVKQSEQSVRLSEKVQEIIAEEQSYIEETNSKFKVLEKEVEMSLEKIDTIAAMTINLGAVKDAVVGNVSELSAVSEENAASNEEAAASISNIVVSVEAINNGISDVKAMSENLTEVVSYFK